MAIGMLLSAAGIWGLTSVESLWIYTPLFLITGIGLGLGWALANVATQAVVPPSAVGAASGVVATSGRVRSEVPALFISLYTVPPGSRTRTTWCTQ